MPRRLHGDALARPGVLVARDRFRSWLRTPHPQSTLDANTLFDLRVAAGTLDLGPLLDEKQAAASDAPFLKALAESCVALDLLLGLFHQLREGSEGLDLKRGIVLIVSLARLFSLASGGREVSTLARLEEASGTLGNSDAATLAEAFSFLLGLRLEHQLRRVRAGREPSGKVALSDLNAMERRFLKEIFTFLRQAQSALPQRFHHERDVALLEVTDAAVHQLGAAPRGSLSEVVLLGQHNPHPYKIQGKQQL